MRDKISAENGGEQKFGEPSTITTHSVTCHIMAGAKKTHVIVLIYINAYTQIDLIKEPFFPSKIPPSKNFTNCYSDQSSISNNYSRQCPPASNPRPRDYNYRQVYRDSGNTHQSSRTTSNIYRRCTLRCTRVRHFPQPVSQHEVLCHLPAKVYDLY